MSTANAVYEMPEAIFEPHPEGVHIGIITEVVDEGVKQTRFGERQRFIIKVEAETAHLDDGAPHMLWIWANRSGSVKAKIVKLRSQLMGRPLTDNERHYFDPAVEMIGRRVQYHVVHEHADEKVYANLANWKLFENHPATRPMAPAPRPTPVRVPATPAYQDGDLAVVNSDDDLPF